MSEGVGANMELESGTSKHYRRHQANTSSLSTLPPTTHLEGVFVACFFKSVTSKSEPEGALIKETLIWKSGTGTWNED